MERLLLAILNRALRPLELVVRYRGEDDETIDELRAVAKQWREEAARWKADAATSKRFLLMLDQALVGHSTETRILRALLDIRLGRKEVARA